MKIKVDKGLLNDALAKVNRAISARTVLPILSGILLEASEEGLSLTGSDSDMSIKSIIPISPDNEIEVDLGGSIVLPARELIAIIKSLPTHVEIESSEDNKVLISSGKSKFTLNGIDPEEYPKIARNTEKSFDIGASKLSDLVRKTVYATSKMDSRPVLMGVNFYNANGRLGAVATDAHRLSRLIDGEVEFEGSFIVNATSVRELPALFKEGNITVSKTEHTVSFKNEDTFVLMRLLSGNFPETDRLIPTDYSTLLTISRRSFLDSLERSKILSADQVATFEISDKSKGIFESVTLSQSNNEVGKSEEEIIVDSIEGEELTISFNAAYVIEALKVIDAETVVFEFSGAMKPFIIKPVGASEDSLNLVLPIRKY